MRKLLFLLFIISCDPRGLITELPPRARPKSVMVCHNPPSEEHQKLCSDECYEKNRIRAFCWEMPYEWCEERPEEKWLIQLCAEVIRERTL
jgi:hypothetical protein